MEEGLQRLDLQTSTQLVSELRLDFKRPSSGRCVMQANLYRDPEGKLFFARVSGPGGHIMAYLPAFSRDAADVEDEHRLEEEYDKADERLRAAWDQVSYRAESKGVILRDMVRFVDGSDTVVCLSDRDAAAVGHKMFDVVACTWFDDISGSGPGK